MGSKCSATKSIKNPSFSPNTSPLPNPTLGNTPNTQTETNNLPQKSLPNPIEITNKFIIQPILIKKRTEHTNSPIIPNEKLTSELKLHRSYSAAKIKKEDATPDLIKRNEVRNIKSKNGKNFQIDENLPIVHNKNPKKTLKYRNSQYLNLFLIEKFSLKINFEQIPKKDGDTSLENPASNHILCESSQLNILNKKDSRCLEGSSNNVKFYFKPEFLNELLQNTYELNTAEMKKYELIYEEKIQDHRMKIFWTNYTSTEKNKVNIFRTEFYVPCHPEFFLSFMNNISEQTKMDLLLDKYYIAEGNTDKSNVIYLSYRKTIISSARDFVYLKHWGKIQKNNDIFYCDTSRSIDHLDYPPFKNIIRGDIIYSGHVVRLVKDENGREISHCRMYSECDFKVNVPAFISKKFSKEEMKAYTERCINRIKELLNVNKKK